MGRNARSHIHANYLEVPSGAARRHCRRCATDKSTSRDRSRVPVDTRMGKHRSEWLDKAGVRGTQKIRFYDYFEADTAGVAHPRDVIGTLRQHSERLSTLES